MSVTEKLIDFIKNNRLPQLCLLIVKRNENRVTTRLFALKFYKCLYTLLEKDQDLLQSLTEEDPIESCHQIIEDLKKRLRNPNMLQSAALELVNVFGE